VLIVSGALVYTIKIEQLNAEPSLISKLNTLLQIMLGLLVVVNQGLYQMPGVILQGLIWAVTVTTIISGFAYVIEWSNRASQRYHDQED